LKRAIEQHLVFPLSSLISTGQIDRGESIFVSMSADSTGLTFSKDESVRKPESEAEST